MEPNTKTNEKVVPFPVDLSYDDATKKFADIVADGYIHLHIDLVGVAHMVSRQISVLVMLYNEVKKINGSVRLINVTDRLYTIFDTLSLNRIIPTERLSDSVPKQSG